MEAAAEVDQAVALFEDLDVLQLQQQHRMGADLLDLGDASLQVGQGAVQHRQPGEALAPVVEGEAAFIGTSVMPAKWRATSSCSPLRTFTQSRPLALNTVFISLLRLMQSISVGGLSVTEQTAVAVIPQRPAGPLLVITLTAAERCAMALRKACCLGSSWDMGITSGRDAGVIGGCGRAR